jgi:hypothetical protein
LLRQLIELLKEIEYDANQSTRSIIQLGLIDMLCCCAQEIYPYQLQNVISNDQLYGSDLKFINEINEIATGVLEELLQILQRMSERPKFQCQTALDLFERVALKADLCDDKLFELAVKLWNLSMKNRHAIDSRSHHKVFNHLQAVRGTIKNRSSCQRMDELLNRMKSKL